MNDKVDFLEESNAKFLFCAYLLIAVQPLQRSLSYLLSLFGVSVSALMYLLYGLVFGLMLYYGNKYWVFPSKMVPLLAIYFFWLVNYIISSDKAKKIYLSADVQVVLWVFIPIAVFIVSNICDWSYLFYKAEYLFLTDAIIIFSFLAKMQKKDNTNYMSYSYDLLPLWGIAFISAFCYKKKLQWFVLVLGIAGGAIYGARGPIVWLAIMIFFIWAVMAIAEHYPAKYIAYVIIAFVAVLIAIKVLLPILLSSSLSESSYVARRLLSGSANSDSGRGPIYEDCKRELSQMGLSVYGIFYDRTVLLENGTSVYAHNIFYEVFMALGWIGGIIFFVVIAYQIIMPFLRRRGTDLILPVYFVCSFLLRYILSGSIFSEGRFILFLCAMYSLGRNYTLDSTIECEEYDDYII